MNRHEFIRAASALTITSLTSASWLRAADTNGRKLLPIVDTHQHLWDTERFKEGWSAPPRPGTFGTREYREATEGLNVVKTIYMEVAVPPGKRHEEALYAIALCKDRSNPISGAVIAVDPNRADFDEYMAEFENSPYVKGIRYFFRSGDEILKDNVVRNITALGRMKMSFDFSIPPAWLPQMAKLASLCRGTQFMVNHCGNVDPKAFFSPEELRGGKPAHDPEQWTADMKRIAANENVACKISGVVTRAPGYTLTAENLRPCIDRCLDIFGPDRVMFASDWPVCLNGMALRGWVDILKKVVAGRSIKDQKKLFHDNALKYYRI